MLLTSATVALMLALTWGGLRYSWASPPVPGQRGPFAYRSAGSGLNHQQMQRRKRAIMPQMRLGCAWETAEQEKAHRSRPSCACYADVGEVGSPIRPRLAELPTLCNHPAFQWGLGHG